MRIYKGVLYDNCDHMSDEEMRLIHKMPVHYEPCPRCLAGMVVDSRFFWSCPSCGTVMGAALDDVIPNG